MQFSSGLSHSGLWRLRERSCVTALLGISLSLMNSGVIFAGGDASAPASQTSLESTHGRPSPPNVLTSPDFDILVKIMHTNITRCGGPFTAVLHWHVLPDGVIDNFVLNKPSGDVCFDEVVILNAEEVVRAQLRITPAMRDGIAEAGWVPLSVASRD